MAEQKQKEIEKIQIKSKNIIAVGSGKGGVGKTTVTVNLALSMAGKGKKVGLLDADIYGPNVPLMLGLENEVAKAEQGKLVPLEKYNLKIMSIAFLAPSDKALIWRGPLAHKVIEQFLKDVDWGNLDVLLIDLPPGTGDVPLSIIQKKDLTGGIIVTTPQEAAIADVKKMIDMFQTTDVDIIGIVENMKYIICKNCSERTDLYPNSDIRSIPEVLGYESLAEFPFEPSIGLKQKDGTPFYLSEKNNVTINEYNKLTEKVLKFLK